MATNIEPLLNDFATRCFRDPADGDYVCARLAYRAKQVEQFHWLALQAIEKYLKAILLYNRIKATNVGHSLHKAMRKTTELPFKLKLSDSTRQLIDHLEQVGAYRYLEKSYFIHGPKLVQLDKAVWEIRRYCKVLDYEIDLGPKGKVHALRLEIEKIDRAADAAPQAFKLMGGALEKILAKRDHPSRAPLVWQNLYYGARRRQRVRMWMHDEGKNSPLFLHPELLGVIETYVKIPNPLLEAYKSLHLQGGDPAA